MPLLQGRRKGDRLIFGPFGSLPPIGLPETPDGFTLGTDKPSPANTGIPPGRPALTSYTGPTTITTPGTVIEDKTITSTIYVRAANVTIRYNNMSGNNGGVDCNHADAKNVLVQQNTMRPTAAAIDNIGVGGHDYTAIRNNISGYVDGFRVHNFYRGKGFTEPSNVQIHGNYVHDLAYTTPWSPQPDNQTHNDCVQLEGCTGTDIYGNFFQSFGDPVLGNIGDRINQSNPTGGPYTQTLSCVIVTPNVSSVSGFRIRKNWMSGAFVKVNVSDKNYGTITDVEYYGNRFERDGAFSNPDTWPPATYDANAARFADNLFANNLAAVSSTRRASGN